jgi:hypothetical protein
MYPTPHTTATIAQQRRSQLMAQADHHRLARDARLASRGSTTVNRPVRVVHRWLGLARALTLIRNRRRPVITATRTAVNPTSSLRSTR